MRLYIKMRPLVSFLIVLFLVSTFNITPSFAQAPQQYQILGSGWTWDFEYSPDSATLATASSDGKVRLWDVETGEIRYTLEHPNVGEVYDVAFSPDGSLLASANSDWKVRLWDVETGEIHRTIVGHNGPVWSVAYSSDGKMIASSSADATRTWDAATGTPLHRLPRGRENAPNNLTFSPDNTTLLHYSDRDPHILLWDVTTGTLRHTFDALRGIYGGFYRAAYSPDNATLAAAFGPSDMVRVWDVVTGALVHRLEHSDFTNDVVYSSNSRTLISSGSDGVRVWDAATGTPIDVLPGAGQYVAYSPDGKVLASHGHTADVLRLWDAATYLPIRTIRGPGGGRTAGFKLNKISYSPDGTTLASRGSGGVVLWRLAPPPSPIIFTPIEVDDQTFTVGTLVSLTLPVATGGTAPYTYTLAPLPNGLQFNPATRVLQGTPLTPMDATAVTYTATDATGASASLTFTITVQDTPSLTDGHIYWINQVPGRILRANLDGTNVQNIVTGLTLPTYLKLDVENGKMYWTSWQTGIIQSANLDGSDLQSVVKGLHNPHSLALDVAGGKIYWTDWTLGKIQRANFNGTNIEDVIATGLIHPDDIDLDVANSKMYWIDTGTVKIQRANLDGTNVEDIVPTSFIGPTALALDLVGRKVYWTDHVTDKIQRANLDGTNVEDLVTTGVDWPEGIAVDPAGGKIYWTDRTDKILRANLDGTNIEHLITTGLSNPHGIALNISQVAAGLRFNPNTIADQRFTVGTAVNLTLPTAIGGTPPYIYTLAPTLPAGLSFDSIANGPGYISGSPTAALPATPFTYTATDTTNTSAALTFTIEVTGTGPDPLDVNGDGQVDVLDLVWVALSYGMRGTNLPGDVNADGIVNIQDLVAVAGGIDASEVLPVKIAEAVLFAAEAAAVELEGVAGAPVMGFSTSEQGFAADVVYSNVADALADARSLASRDVRLGKWMPLLEELLQVLAELGAIPEATALLPNYPNPFNPETWIPYHLAQDAEVVLTIYDVRGVLVRELALGYQSAGVYQSKHRAGYWDGRNDVGEKVSSGVYFYTLTAGDFNATRKLLIMK